MLHILFAMLSFSPQQPRRKEWTRFKPRTAFQTPFKPLLKSRQIGFSLSAYANLLPKTKTR
ncbi:hypothetical protein AKG43_06660 [Neisseria sp. 74A18]|nr:hypothetical protein AKG43_06660 [Neisseria sp. 74A18]